MSKPKVLIVGCGAVGLTQGYFLSSGAEITYLVRPGRKPAFQAPKKLYDYKENALRVFDNYRVVESTSEVSGEEFKFVFDTLDGHTARSEGGAATLKAVGDLIRDHPATFVVYDAIGLDIEDYYAATMGIAKERLLLGISILAHQPTKSISLPANADGDLAGQADMLYSYGKGNFALIVVNSKPKLTKALGEMYSKHEKLRIQTLPGFVGSSGGLLGMVQLMAWCSDGFQPFDEFRNHKEVWNLMLKAQTEILTLPRFGWTGWLISRFIGSWATSKMFGMQIEGALPMLMHEFNAYHHGSKVVKQDLMALEDVVAEGEKGKHKMVALREICRRAEQAAARTASSG
ncbi:ketopantoate reductase ApbA/PanE domain-containing protein [Ophiobolus disseminans]|uniref:Ketopantoate reductase ApbA/PanE domain-containing protein n=1 Tax=Ophiobolus disseminans TaxID=1469910 RepID=A0A6A6ZBW0_9PLEO|nr:ketopantoate reductase ApbA/PanE domain-containing protein [Ophiobolus disseminans]